MELLTIGLYWFKIMNMKKTISIIFLVFGLAISACAQVKLYTDQLIADSMSTNGTSFINEFSTDGTFGGNSDRAVPTEKAAKTYVDGKLSVADTTGFLTLTDTTYNRVMTKVDFDLKLTKTDTTAFLTLTDTTYNRVMTKVDSDLKLAKTDTTAFLTVTDTTYNRVANQWDIDNCEATDSLHNHANKGTLDGVTAAFTTALNTRLADINDTTVVVINITTDTLTSTEVYSGGIFPIGLELNGWRVYRAQAFSPNPGDGDQDIKAYRIRNLVGTGSAFITDMEIGGTGDIDTDYDDMVTGDYLNFGYKETGTSDYTIGVDVILTFIRP